MQKSVYLIKCVPLLIMLLGAVVFFSLLQYVVQNKIKTLQKPGATIHLSSGWIKVKNSILPTLKFNEGTLGGKTVVNLGNTLFEISSYIMPVGVAVTMLFSIFAVLGFAIKEFLEKRY